MNKKNEKADVGASLSVIAVVASIVAVIMLATGIYLYRTVNAVPTHDQLVIGTGPDSGTYHALGSALKAILEQTDLFSSIEVLDTDGSEENMRLLGSAEAGLDLAFVQADTYSGANAHARLIATLYDEVLHIILGSAGDDILTIHDLEGRRITLGPAGSGTRDLSTRVLNHFGITPAEDLAMSPAEAAQQLTAGTIDAAFMLSAIPSKLIADLAIKGDIRFLSLGDVTEEGDESHALELVFPGVKSAVIPRSTYIRLPRKAIHTISVAAILVARSTLDEELIRQITATMYENRSGPADLTGSALLVARKIRENYDPSIAPLPYHPGATAYYRREDPPFFVEYAEALSLGMTILLALYSMFIAIREWTRRRMKNRVDAYLLQVESLVAERGKMDSAQLETLHIALEELRREAFDDLIAERLLADEAFTILQNHLRDELASTEKLFERMTRERSVQ